MLTKFIEVTNGFNWGKFEVSQYTEEDFARKSVVDPARSLLGGRGWTPQHLKVFDLQTGEGVFFRKGGLAKADLDNHKIWVCPLFEPFLEWIYVQSFESVETLPDFVTLSEAPADMRGYRREGRSETEACLVKLSEDIVHPKVRQLSAQVVELQNSISELEKLFYSFTDSVLERSK